MFILYHYYFDLNKQLRTDFYNLIKNTEQIFIGFLKMAFLCYVWYQQF